MRRQIFSTSCRTVISCLHPPTDAVPFIARSLDPSSGEQVEVKCLMDWKALTQYSPGKEIVVKKKTYMSGGLYIDFPPRPTAEEIENMTISQQYELKVSSVINRFSYWFKLKEENANDSALTWHHRCTNSTCQHTRKHIPRSSTPEAFAKCEMCGVAISGQYLFSDLQDSHHQFK